MLIYPRTLPCAQRSFGLKIHLDLIGMAQRYLISIRKFLSNYYPARKEVRYEQC